MGVLEARRSRSSDLRPQAEINVTPLVDVMLVLLVVFMVTAPMLTAGLPVDLPKAATARPLERSEPAVVTLDRDGKVQLNGKDVAVDGLGDAILALSDGDRTRAIHVRALWARAVGWSRSRGRAFMIARIASSRNWPAATGRRATNSSGARPPA